MNPLLAVDIGNSAIKVGQFAPPPRTGYPAPTRVWEFRFRPDLPLFDHSDAHSDAHNDAHCDEKSTSQFPRWNDFAKSLEGQRYTWLVSSVHRGREQELTQWMGQNRSADDYRVLNHHDIPMVVDVQFPDRVGFDRLATSVAADRLRPTDVPAIVIDAGTALKVHAVSRQGSFVGGAIFPGYRLAGRVLAVQTDLLPEVGVSSQDHAPPAIGKTTEGAIRSGLFWGFAGAARELVGRISAEIDGEPVIYVSGGDARGLVLSLGSQARFVSDMCLSGIAIIQESLAPA